MPLRYKEKVWWHFKKNFLVSKGYKFISIISIFAHKGFSTAISHIIDFTDTKRSHHVERTDYSSAFIKLYRHFLFPSQLSGFIFYIFLYAMTLLTEKQWMETWLVIYFKDRTEGCFFSMFGTRPPLVLSLIAEQHRQETGRAWAGVGRISCPPLTLLLYNPNYRFLSVSLLQLNEPRCGFSQRCCQRFSVAVVWRL